MKFSTFVEAAETLKHTSKTNDKIEKAANLLEVTDRLSDDGNAVSIVPRFVQGQVFPKKQQRNLSMGGSLMRTAVSEATGIDEEQLKSKITDVADMGELFDLYDIKHSGQTSLTDDPVTVEEVYDVFNAVADESGSGSQQRKVDHIVSLLSRCSSTEAKYITRLVLDDMSIGVGEGTVRDAIAQSNAGVSADLVEEAIMYTNDIGHVSSVANQDGAAGLRDIDLSVGEVAVSPMLASLVTIPNVFDEIGEDEILVDRKYDGFRIQIHKNGDDVRLFTRRLDDVTESLPDVVEMVQDNIESETAVLDGEVVGYETKDYNIPLDYQTTQKRNRRKYDIDEMVDKIPVKPKIFDVLYTGEDGLLIDDPLSDRLDTLDGIVPDDMRAEQTRCDNVPDVLEFVQQAIKDGHEGGMAKRLSSSYKPNSRGKRWLKIKPEGETVDAVVIGGMYGTGQRTGDISSYELGLWNDDGELESIGDVGTGFSDEEYDRLTDMLEPEILSRDGNDIEVNPNVVMEVEFEKVQPSPKYESGYGLRFPRFIRVCETKGVDDADTVSRLEDIAEKL